MSLGSAKNIVAIVPIVSYQVFISPNGIFTLSDAGASTSAPATANASGGSGIFTYLWEKVSGGNINIKSPTSKSTSFTASGSANDEVNGVFRVTVDDSVNANIQATINISFLFDPI